MTKFLLPFFLLLSACAALHHVQLSDVDNRTQFTAVPIEVKVSEVGVSIGEAKAISKALMTNAADRQAADKAGTILESFQMGPRTGSPVYSDTYAEHIVEELRSQCPNGKITGVESIRESRNYPVIKGEIVKIKAYCLREKGA